MSGEHEVESGATFRHLLIPLDGSEMSEAVVPSAARLASLTGAMVTLLHLIEKDAPALVHGNRHITVREEAEIYLQHVAATYFPGQNVNWHVHIEGTPSVARGVSSHVVEFNPDLIIMCAHKHIGWFRGCLGQQVVHNAMPPVLLLRYVDTISTGFPFHRILIPLDGNPEHESGVAVGGALARLSGAPVDLLQVVPTRATLSGDQGVASSYLPAAIEALLDLAEDQARKYLAAHLERLHQGGVTGAATIVRGEPFEEIISFTERIKPDLIILGTHGKIGTKAFWAGSVAQRILESCNTTFLLTPASE